ncbi:unnamed protein product, partial [Didymodactylos carnosus]
DDCDAYTLMRLSDIIRSLLVTYSDSYLIYFDSLAPHFHRLLERQRSVSDRQWSLHVWNDIIQYTGETSFRYQQYFLQRMAESVQDVSAEICEIASYGFGVMGMYVVAETNSRSDDNIMATENAIIAVTKILKYNNSKIENFNKLLEVWLSWLPIRESTEEASYVYDYLCDLA